MSSVLYTCAALFHLMGGARCQGTAVLTVSSNPVYSGDTVVLTCSYGEENSLSFVTIDAINHTHKEGSLWCRVPKPNATGFGVFSGKTLTGCPFTSAGSSSVSVSMTASPSLDLDFRCKTTVTNVDENQYTLTSSTVSLLVHVLPSVPKFLPNPLTFTEGENATIVCESHNGKPESAVTLTVSSLNGSQLTASGMGSASMTLHSPLRNWHNVPATCNVTNHKFSNMTTSSIIQINHISCASDSSCSVLHDANLAVLDCSTYINSDPAPNYTWTVRPEINATILKSLLSVPMSALQQEQSETFICTAINDIIKQAVNVVISVNSSHSSSTGKNTKFKLSSHCSSISMPAQEPLFGDETLRGTALHTSIYIVIFSTPAVAIFCVVIFRKRKTLLQMKSLFVDLLPCSMNAAAISKNQDEEISMVENDLYVEVNPQNSNDAQQHPCDREPRAVEDLYSETTKVPFGDTDDYPYADADSECSSLKNFPATSSQVKDMVKAGTDWPE